MAAGNHPEAPTRPRWFERLLPIVVVAVVVAMAVWRWVLVGAGPDPDSDAYGHYTIARQILLEPSNLRLHWVWLPLFHWLQLPLVAAGGEMQLVRQLNVVLWLAAPLLLFWHLRPTHAVGAAVAAVLMALCPIGMQMGTTAQPEPLFALLLLGFAIAMERERYPLAALLLLPAVLLRYESWAVLAVSGGWWLWRLWRHKRQQGEPLPHVAVLVPLLPGLAILAWALMRWPVDGSFLGFIGATGDFARGAQGVKSVADFDAATHLASVAYYPMKIAKRVFGWSVVLVPFGVAAVARSHRWLSATGAACLGFISLSWIMRSSLGLDRHFVSVIAWYASAMAFAAVTLVEWAAKRSSKLAGSSKEGEWARRWLAVGVLSLLPIAELSYRLEVWMGHWRYSIENGYPDRIAVADFLRRAPTSELLFCDEATVEVLSKLGRERFERRSIGLPLVRRRIFAVAKRQGGVYVASWIGKLKPLRAHGRIVFRPKGANEKKGLAVLRIEP